MRRHATAVALLLVVGSISGCAEYTTTGVPADSATLEGVAESIAPRSDPLIGTSWTLASTSDPTLDLAGLPITAMFGEGLLSGQAPVNTYRAPY